MLDYLWVVEGLYLEIFPIACDIRFTAAAADGDVDEDEDLDSDVVDAIYAKMYFNAKEDSQIQQKGRSNKNPYRDETVNPHPIPFTDVTWD